MLHKHSRQQHIFITKSVYYIHYFSYNNPGFVKAVSQTDKAYIKPHSKFYLYAVKNKQYI